MASNMAPIDLPDSPEEPQEGPKNAPRELEESPERAKPMKTLTFGMGWWGCAKREEFKCPLRGPKMKL